MSNKTRTAAHAAIDRAPPEDLARVAHNLVEDLCGTIDAIARQCAAQTHHYINRPRPSTSPPPSKETEAELLQERQVVALERMPYARNLREAAELLELSISKVKELVASGVLDGVRIEKTTWITPESMRAFVRGAE